MMFGAIGFDFQRRNMMTDEEKAHIKELLEAPMAAEEKERLLPIILDRPTIREGLSDWIEFIRLKRQ
jgi:hypothetical protein